MDDMLLTVKEAAEYLRISPWTLYRWQKEKCIPVMKVGGVNRFRKRDLDEWLRRYEENRA